MLFVPSQKIKEINLKFLNILFFCFPVSFLVGNGVINIVIFLICLTGVLAFSLKIFSNENTRILYIILCFFILIFISTLLDVLEDPSNEHFFKSLSYFRYFLLFLVTSAMIRTEKLNFKYFLISCSLCTLFLSLDIIYQFINGSDLFGFEAYEKSKYHLAGFLKDEYMAGGYIQKFFIFTLVLFPFISKKFEEKKYFISVFLTVIFFMGILYSGNRMPLVIFILSIFLIIIFIKDLRIPLIIGSIFCSLIFYNSFKNYDNLKNYYLSFYDNGRLVIDYVKKYSFKKYPELENKKDIYFAGEAIKDKSLASKYESIPFASGHHVIYLTAIDLWADDPIIGNGIKSFRIKCLTKLYLPNRVCEGHPHNYYLELLNDTGIVGLLIFLLIVFLLLKSKLFHLKKYDKKEKLLIICIFIIIFCELFPLRSTGSFFTTQNSAYIFFILGILDGFKKIKI
tara:strand:- start:17412 stop:18770 length:1359 start_codon:yes stop_codon:yes gene_type:complete